MRRSRMHLIVNPAANRGRSGRVIGRLSELLVGSDVEPKWYVTNGPDEARRITASLPEDEVVVAVGGDGTVHEVSSACIGTGRVMGVVPTGSGNDYVKALGAGFGRDFERTVEVLLKGRVRTVDAGVVNGTTFNNGLGIGFDAEVAQGVATAPACLGGTGRYLWSVGRLLVGFGCHRATLTFGETGEVVEAETILVAAALGTTYGARFRLAPESKLDDGLFDVVWSEKIDRRDVLRILPSALSGSLYRHKEINVRRTASLTVELAEAVPAHVDGEMLAPTRRFEAEVLPGALRVIAP
ncbi:TIGR00147: lipid kinase, YegS/Rv2252/BmrU family [Rubrobacter radiotolerans]|uniref:TIGR00147: lipid kinase, YegS/Rv2252/BmrU family n=1 Tax=Rubrobacter radiotolerans TaxID=42256 RepID=A0A023X013_RUBRA|nr:YegS/Rv2252/BmrU family lipid kinase [Rubrobacter radiotolerans]AHY45526.1 TIGR00147: lipid kinase, YegS/Rv2252/BmrU family [Rubrobacter radiotolerans]